MIPRSPASPSVASDAVTAPTEASSQADRRAAPYASHDALVASFAEHVHPGKVRTFAALGLDVVMGEREGPRFQDAVSGRWLWNCHSNGGVFNLGHRNPTVIAALRRALDDLDIGNHHLVSGWRAQAAERLVASTDGRLSGVVFTVSGGEAIDVAIKVARGMTGRRRVVTTEGAYHGATGLAVAAGGDAPTRERYLLDLPDFVHVPYDDLPAMEAAIDADTALVLLEAIPATLGFPPPSPGYLAGVQARCREHGALLVVDEVQTGLGRTGTWWFHTQEGVDPDVLIVGKALSGGIYPVSAVLLRDRPFRWFTEEFGSHPSSFGGSELGCVVANTVCELVGADGFLDHVGALAARFARGFADAPFGVRQRGLTMGFETGREGGAFDAWAQLFGAGVFAFPAAYDTSVLQFKPPLILRDEEADTIIELVRTVLG
jgi:putrescine aminotransferase